jgi:hypothetical protein
VPFSTTATEATLASAVSHRSSALSGIILGGFTVGVLDTLLAISLWHVSPLVVYKSVASGLLGRAAYRGGLGTVLLGMFLHFFIGISAAAVYWIGSHYLPVVGRVMLSYWLPLGLTYGVAVYYFMDIVVLPLSRVPNDGSSEPMWRVLGSIIGHAFLVGLPISWFAHHYSKEA